MKQIAAITRFDSTRVSWIGVTLAAVALFGGGTAGVLALSRETVSIAMVAIASAVPVP